MRSFQTPPTPLTSAWPPARDLVGEGVELVDHRVDGLLELEDLAADVDGDLLRQVALGDACGHGGDVANLAGQVARHHVHAVGEVLPDASDAHDLGLAAQLALSADLACDTGHLACERVELVDHRVDGLLELEDLAADVDGDLLREVALLNRGRNLGDVSDLARQVARHQVDVVGQVLPHASHAAHVCLAAELALGAHLARHTRDLVRKSVQLTHHRVDRPGGGEELSLEGTTLDRQRHRLGKVAVGHRADDSRDLGVGLGQVLDQVVDGVERGRPGAPAVPRRRALELPLFACVATEAADLAFEALVALDDVVDGGGHLARQARQARRHADGKVAALHRRQHGEGDGVVDRRPAVGVIARARDRALRWHAYAPSFLRSYLALRADLTR